VTPSTTPSAPPSCHICSRYSVLRSSKETMKPELSSTYAADKNSSDVSVCRSSHNSSQLHTATLAKIILQLSINMDPRTWFSCKWPSSGRRQAVNGLPQEDVRTKEHSIIHLLLIQALQLYCLKVLAF